MTTQLDLPTQLELATLKRAWIDEESDAVLRSFSSGNQFTIESVRPFFKPAPHDNWYGCLIAKLRCAGHIKEVGRVRSERPERNGAKISLWEVI